MKVTKSPFGGFQPTPVGLVLFVGVALAAENPRLVHREGASPLIIFLPGRYRRV